MDSDDLYSSCTDPLHTKKDEEEEISPVMFTVPGNDAYLSPSSSNDSLSLPELHSHPFHFHHVMEELVPKGHVVVPRVLCHTCNHVRSSLYCFPCINRGEFTSSRSDQVLKEKFSELKFKLFSLMEERQQIGQSMNRMLEPSVERDILREKVLKQSKNVQALKKQMEEKKGQLQKLQNQKVDMDLVRTQAEQAKKTHCGKKANALKHVEKQRSVTTTRGESVKKNEDSIRQLTWDLAVQLRSDIFCLDISDQEETEGPNPNAESIPLLGYSSFSTSSSTSTLTQTSTRKIESRYIVVEPWMSGDFDVTPFSQWVNHHREEIASSTAFDSVEKRNDAFRIAAVLSYLAHMSEVLAGILDIRLPRRMPFKDFYSKSISGGGEEFLSEKELTYRVAKLNTNISYICLSQKMDPNLISPRHPVHNLINLLNPSLYNDLGRRGPIPMDSDFADLLERHLSIDLSLVEESLVLEDDDDIDMTPDFDEMGFENIPNWVVEGTAYYNYQDSQSIAQAQSFFSPTNVLGFSLFSRLFNRE